jgi:hypothetical protein
MARPWSARCYGVARQREGSRPNSIGGGAICCYISHTRPREVFLNYAHLREAGDSRPPWRPRLDQYSLTCALPQRSRVSYGVNPQLSASL